MTLSTLCKAVSLAAAMSIVPGLLAASSTGCQDGSPTPESYTWNFPKEAGTLLQRMQIHADKARDLADHLRAYDRSDVDWHADSILLEQMRSQVNIMDEELCRLRTIERVALPWQRKAIDRVEPAVLELSDVTEAAIEYLNSNQENLWNPDYIADANYMYKDANRIVNIVGSFNEYAKAMNEIRELRPGLGLARRSNS